jgi:hypothetical protein
VRGLDHLERLLAVHPDDRDGNTSLAEYLWGYKLWTRARQLRELTRFRNIGVVESERLRAWPHASDRPPAAIPPTSGTRSCASFSPVRTRPAGNVKGSNEQHGNARHPDSILRQHARNIEALDLRARHHTLPFEKNVGEC